MLCLNGLRCLLTVSILIVCDIVMMAGFFQKCVMSLLGEDFSLFRMFVWHCMNLIKGSTRLIPYFNLLVIRLLKVALMGM